MTSTLQAEHQPLPFFHRLWHSRSDLLFVLAFLLLTALYALLMLTDSIPLWDLILLAVLCLLHWLINPRPLPLTPLHLPIFLLLCLLPLSLLITVDLALTLPKVNGLVLSALLFYLLAHWLSTNPRPRLVITFLLLLAFATGLLCLLAGEWPASGPALLQRVYLHLPSLLRFSPRSAEDLGLNGNTIGGALAFLIPLLLSLFWLKRTSFPRSPHDPISPRRTRSWVYQAVLILLLLFLSAILLLSQSRGALLGTLAGVFLVAILKNKRFLWLIPALILLFVALWLLFPELSLPELISRLDTSEDPTLPTRLEVWQAALYQVRNLPLTGGGLGAFSRLYAEFYSIQGKIAFHAHNILLTVATDQGIPALVLYLALLGGFAGMAVKVYKTADRQTRALVIGLAAGMLAHLVFGFTDSYMLGAKLGAILWIYMGVMAGLFAHQAGPTSHIAPKMLLALAGWVLLALLSIALVNINPLLSLSQAVIGGSLLGWQLVLLFKAGSK